MPPSTRNTNGPDTGTENAAGATSTPTPAAAAAGTAPKANATAPAAGAKKTYFAQRHILHGDTPIIRGKQLPDDFPASSIDALLKAGDIAEAQPGATKIETKEGDAK